MSGGCAADQECRSFARSDRVLAVMTKMPNLSLKLAALITPLAVSLDSKPLHCTCDVIGSVTLLVCCSQELMLSKKCEHVQHQSHRRYLPTYVHTAFHI